MGRLLGLSRRRRLLVALAVGGVAFGIAQAVQASIPDAGGVIHGCYKSVGGALRVIDTGKGGKCVSSETALNWGQTGPTGTKGATGPTGATGPVGPSDLWVGFGSVALLQPKPSPPTTISTVTVPNGNYFLSGELEGFSNTSATARAVCDLSSTDPGTSVSSQSGSGHTIPPGDDDTWTMLGLATVTSGPSTLNLSCQEFLGNTTVVVQARVFAQSVGTIH